LAVGDQIPVAELNVPGEDGDEPGASAVLGSDAYAELVELVGRIRDGRTDGMAELYQLFSKGIRFYLCRQLGPQEIDDKVHDTFVVVVQAIRKGELREPQRLMVLCAPSCGGKWRLTSTGWSIAAGNRPSSIPAPGWPTPVEIPKKRLSSSNAAR
jgi:hypothetical protein